MKKFVFDKELSKCIDFYSIGKVVLDNNSMDKKLIELGYLKAYLDLYNRDKNFLEKLELMNYDELSPLSFYRFLEIEELKENNDIDKIREVLLNKNELEIRKAIISAIVNDEKEVEEYINNPLSIFDLIEDCKVNDITKGRLTRAISKPKEAMKEYLDILFSFRDDFEEIYSKYEDELIDKAQEYEKILNKKGLAYIKEKMKDFLNAEFEYLNKYREVNLFVSMFMQLGIKIDYGINFILLGKDFDKMLEIIHQINKTEEINKTLIFKNLGDETRFKIFSLIANGITKNKELAQKCNVTKPTITYHINQMIVADMIKVDEKYKYSIKKDVVINFLKNYINELENIK